MKKFLSIVILVFLLTSLVSCYNEVPPVINPIETDADETDTPQTDIPETNPPETIPPENEPLVVYEYTPSLENIESVQKIGVRVGDVIVEAACAGGAGQLFDIWEGQVIVGVACDGGNLEPKITPIVKYSPGMEIAIYNNMDYGEITSDVYFKLDPSVLNESMAGYDSNTECENIPNEPGLYCYRITHVYSPEIDMSNLTPENIDPEMLEHMVGYMYFYVFIVVE